MLNHLCQYQPQQYLFSSHYGHTSKQAFQGNLLEAHLPCPSPPVSSSSWSPASTSQPNTALVIVVTISSPLPAEPTGLFQPLLCSSSAVPVPLQLPSPCCGKASHLVYDAFIKPVSVLLSSHQTNKCASSIQSHVTEGQAMPGHCHCSPWPSRTVE